MTAIDEELWRIGSRCPNITLRFWPGTETNIWQ